MRTSSERRCQPRFAATKSNAVSVLESNSGSWPARLVDISESGAKIVTTSPLNSETKLPALQIHLSGVLAFRLPIRIEHFYEVGRNSRNERTFVAGVSFAPNEDAKDIESAGFLASLVQARTRLRPCAGAAVAA